MKYSIFDVSIVRDRIGKILLQQAVTYLIKHSDTILDTNGLARLSQTKIFSSTPISRLYQELVESDKLNQFLTINLMGQSEVPEALTISDIVIDGKAVQTLPIPTRMQKCWVNLTAISSKIDPYSGLYNITDSTTLANLYVRAALITGYEDNVLWLSPKLSAFVIESYATTIGTELSRIYGLDFNETQFVQTLFAAYYAQLLGGELNPTAYPILLNRCGFLGSSNDILERLKSVEALNTRVDKLWTVDTICNALRHQGPHRLHKLTTTQLYRFLSSSSTDSITMAIALEYPPYWVYQLLRVASGAKIPTMSNVIKLRNTKGKIIQFASDLITSGAVINKLKRTQG